MICFGNVPAGSVLPVIFGTYGKTNGESITLTGLAVTDIEVYKGTSMTQRASDAGYTLLDTDGIDIDGVTGIHGFSIDTGDNTDAGFYAAGSFYTVVVSAVTVDSQTVNFVAATFRLIVAENTAGTPVVDVGRISNDATAADNAEAFFDGTGYAGTNNVIPTVTSLTNGVNVTSISGDSVAADNLEAALDGTGGVTITAAITGNVTGNLSGSVGSVTGAVGSVTGNVGGNVVGSVGSVTGLTAADVGAIKAKTDNLPAAPAATGDIPSAVTVAAAVWAYAVEGSVTAVQWVRVVFAAVAGKSSGHESGTPVYRDQADTKARITATTDANGNRTGVTIDGA